MVPLVPAANHVQVTAATVEHLCNHTSWPGWQGISYVSVALVALERCLKERQDVRCSQTRVDQQHASDRQM